MDLSVPPRRLMLAVFAAGLLFTALSAAQVVGLDDLDAQLLLAVKTDQADFAKSLLKRGADPNTRDADSEYNETALHVAVLKRHLSVAEILLQNGANPYLEDAHRGPVLFYAARDEKTLRLLLTWKVPIDSENSEGTTALIRNFYDPETIPLLLKHGASPNHRTKMGQIPIVEAGEHAEAALAIAMIKAGANVNLQDAEGNTALIKARDSVYQASVQPLLEAGADVKIRNKAGQNALMAGIGRNEAGDQVLLESGADTNLTDADGSTALMLAAARSATKTVRALLARGAEVKARNRNGETALHYAAGATPYFEKPDEEAAARKQPSATMALLLAAGADLAAQDEGGRSPLHRAVANGYTESARFLLEKKADINQTARDGSTALHLGLTGGGRSPEDSAEKVQLLVASGAALDNADRKGRTPLLIAVEEMNRGYVQLLLKNKVAGKPSFDSLLLIAARSFHERHVKADDYAAIVAALSARSTDVNIRDPNGMTPLMWVAASNVPAAVESLLEHRADLELRTRDGRTALMWAAASGAGKSVKVLLKRGAEDSARDNDGRTAGDWAKWMDQEEARLLLEPVIR